MSVRVYHISKILNLENKKVIELLNGKGLHVTSASNTVPNIYADSLIEDYRAQYPERVVACQAVATETPTSSHGHSKAADDDSIFLQSAVDSEKDGGELCDTVDGEKLPKVPLPIKVAGAPRPAVQLGHPILLKELAKPVVQEGQKKDFPGVQRPSKDALPKGQFIKSRDEINQEKEKERPDYSKGVMLSNDAQKRPPFSRPPSNQQSFRGAPQQPYNRGSSSTPQQQPSYGQQQSYRGSSPQPYGGVQQRGPQQPYGQQNQGQPPRYRDQQSYGSQQHGPGSQRRFPQQQQQQQAGGGYPRTDNTNTNARGNFQAPNRGFSAPQAPSAPRPFVQNMPFVPAPMPSMGGAGQSNRDVISGAAEPSNHVVIAKTPIVIRDLAIAFNLKPFRLIAELLEMGIFASINQMVDEDVALRLAKKHGIALEIKHKAHKADPAQVLAGQHGTSHAKAKAKPVEDELQFLEPRPPIVCVLGHVDHGKTTLLDAIRKTNVVASEAGGITQHIGAYQIDYKAHKITFIDTPGHAAFSKMRERGANVTDIAILVVAADDSFMPQTDEALKFIQKANVPIVVAINKMDAKGANVQRVKQHMQQRGITSEDWGGEIQAIEVSALKGEHIDKLLDAVLLQAEMMELKANPKRPAEGIIVETQMEQGLGTTASAIIQRGTLKAGEAIVCGPCYCKVRAMMDDKGGKVKEAPPSMPISILGWSDLPAIGSTFKVVGNEKVAKREAEEASNELKEQQLPSAKKMTLQDIMEAVDSKKKKLLKIIVLGDVQGSVEALVACLNEIKSERISLEIIASGVGLISKNDINNAHAAGAVIIGFSTKLEHGALAVAKHQNVQIIQHNIIYEIVNLVKEALADLLDPELKENKLGGAEVRQVFELSKDLIAGCMVTDGRVVRDGNVRLIRKKEIVAQGKITGLRRLKEDVTEVKAGYECGLQISGHPIYQVGDFVECFEITKVRPPL